MRAFLLTGHGGLDRHRFVTGWPIPEPGPKEVRVHACGLNTVDVNTRVGRYAREVQAPPQGEGFGVEVGAWSGRVWLMPNPSRFTSFATRCGRMPAYRAAALPPRL